VGEAHPREQGLSSASAKWYFQQAKNVEKRGRSPLRWEGVKDDHREPYRSDKVIITTAELEDFQFSVPLHGSRSWINFLRSLLSVAEEGSVFTHGEVRRANIMVKLNDCNNYVVTSIIDWETSGFYPDYYESSKLFVHLQHAHRN